MGSLRDRDETIDQLLHDAEHKDAGAEFARRIGHHEPAAEMEAERDDLIGQALALDPQREAPAWGETNLPLRQVRAVERRAAKRAAHTSAATPGEGTES